MCHGKKDFVKVVDKSSSKDKIKKRLLLASLHEIYVQFKDEQMRKLVFRHSVHHDQSGV